MRNTLEFPVTQAEMLLALDDAIALMQPRGIGDIRPVALREARRIVAASGTSAGTAETAQQAQGDSPQARPDAHTSPERRTP